MPAVTDWQEVGEGIWTRRYSPYSVNVTAIDVGGGFVLIDTRGSMTQGRELAADVGSLAAQPVLAVVNTHEHFDHTFGNGAFDVPTWGHTRCAEHLSSSGEQQRAAAQSWVPEEAHDELNESPIVPPDNTFDDEATLDVGDREVRLLHLGRGHTDNDVIIVVEESDVVIAGDLVEEGAPPAFGDAYPFDWPQTVERMLEHVSGPVVPGHGEIVDEAFVRRQQRELAGVAVMASKHLEEGAPLSAMIDGGPFPADVMELAIERARLEQAGR
ncbi:MAG: MBL fold metallo-hydrolase [Nitriliruptorales bacterium]|nr:MBL fold metallo-hydrolase [Nitriliruptorales bacterium]